MNDERIFEREHLELTPQQQQQKEKFSKGLVKLAEDAGMEPGDYTSEEIQDMMRAMMRRLTAPHLRPFLETVGMEQAISLIPAEDAWKQGDRIGTLSLKGRKLAVACHLVATMPFSTRDIALEQAKTQACDADLEDPETDGAFVLAVHPGFRFTHDSEGRILKVVIQAGWLLTPEGWRDVCHSPKGADDIEDQLTFFRSGTPSRGFFRDRGFDSKQVLRPLTQLAAEVDSLSEIRDMVQEVMDVPYEELSDPKKYTLATGPDGWSRMMHRDLLEAMQQKMDRY